MTRVLIYSSAARDAADFERIVEAALGPQRGGAKLAVLVVSDSPDCEGFRLGRGIYRVYLPPVDAACVAAPCPTSRAELIVNTVREFGPDAVVVDAVPPADAHDLQATLGYIKDHLPGTSRVLLRDGDSPRFPDDPHAEIPDAAVENLYDRVLAFH